MTVGLIWAQAANGVIGRQGTLPWHLPEDLARFRAITTGASVVMGRRTWESLPARFRPLPGRHNVVLTRDPSWTADGAEVVHELAEALRADNVWVIGGASVYALALPYADWVAVTELREPVDGDVRAPELGAGWVHSAVDPASGWHEAASGLHYRWVDYRRDAPTPCR